MIPENTGKIPMNTVDCSVAYIADRLVRTEMIESQVKRPEAERAVARRIGLSASTLDELRRGRIKNVDHVGGKIRRAFISFLERQLHQIEAELATARLVERDVDYSEVEAAIAAAKRALGK